MKFAGFPPRDTEPHSGHTRADGPRSPLLEVAGLTVELQGRRVVSDVHFDLTDGQRCGLIGRSGSGKSLTALALIGLLPPGARVLGSLRHHGVELTELSQARMARLRGGALTMIFQESPTALNPLTRVERHVTEPLRRHRGLSRGAAREAALDLLRRVGFPDPESTARRCPPQLSGGQRQRVGIAMALACRPALLIADEPTTALDVTVQAEILDLLDSALAGQERPALLLISHDLAVVARLCERALVMDGGRIVERGTMADLLREPRAPHTMELLHGARALEAGLPDAHRTAYATEVER